MRFSSLVALEVVKLIAPGGAGGENFIQIMTFNELYLILLRHFLPPMVIYVYYLWTPDSIIKIFMQRYDQPKHIKYDIQDNMNQTNTQTEHWMKEEQIRKKCIIAQKKYSECPECCHWLTERRILAIYLYLLPDSKVHGANMGPIWGLSAPAGLCIGPVNLSICAS